MPSESLHLHAPLDEGSGSSLHVTVDAASQTVALVNDPLWTEGLLAAHALQINRTGVAQVPGAGDFSQDQPFSYGVWIKLPTEGLGAIVARMDNQHDYRGWDLWVEQRRVGTHIIHKWSEDALKVVTRDQLPADKWTHVLVTYDGSKKAAGVKVYVDGEAQATTVQADSLENTIHTDVPLKIGQRNSSDPLPGLALQDLRLYGRALTPQEAKSLAQGTRLAAFLAQSSAELTAAQQDELYNWWLPSLDKQYIELTATAARLEQEQNSDSAHGARSLTSCRNAANRPRPMCCPAVNMTSGATKLSPDTPAILPPMPTDAPRNRLGLARWLMAPESSAHGACDGEPVLAGSIWDRAGEDLGGFRGHGRSAEPS